MPQPNLNNLDEPELGVRTRSRSKDVISSSQGSSTPTRPLSRQGSSQLMDGEPSVSTPKRGRRASLSGVTGLRRSRRLSASSEASVDVCDLDLDVIKEVEPTVENELDKVPEEKSLTEAKKSNLPKINGVAKEADALEKPKSSVMTRRSMRLSVSKSTENADTIPGKLHVIKENNAEVDKPSVSSTVKEADKPDLSKTAADNKSDLSKTAADNKSDLSKTVVGNQPDLSKTNVDDKPDLTKIAVHDKPDFSKTALDNEIEIDKTICQSPSKNKVPSKVSPRKRKITENDSISTIDEKTDQNEQVLQHETTLNSEIVIQHVSSVENDLNQTNQPIADELDVSEEVVETESATPEKINPSPKKQTMEKSSNSNVENVNSDESFCSEKENITYNAKKGSFDNSGITRKSLNASKNASLNDTAVSVTSTTETDSQLSLKLGKRESLEMKNVIVKLEPCVATKSISKTDANITTFKSVSNDKNQSGNLSQNTSKIEKDNVSLKGANESKSIKLEVTKSPSKQTDTTNTTTSPKKSNNSSLQDLSIASDKNLTPMKMKLRSFSKSPIPGAVGHLEETTFFESSVLKETSTHEKSESTRSLRLSESADTTVFISTSTNVSKEQLDNVNAHNESLELTINCDDLASSTMIDIKTKKPNETKNKNTSDEKINQSLSVTKGVETLNISETQCEINKDKTLISPNMSQNVEKRNTGNDETIIGIESDSANSSSLNVTIDTVEKPNESLKALKGTTKILNDSKQTSTISKDETLPSAKLVNASNSEIAKCDTTVNESEGKQNESRKSNVSMQNEMLQSPKKLGNTNTDSSSVQETSMKNTIQDESIKNPTDKPTDNSQTKEVIEISSKSSTSSDEDEVDSPFIDKVISSPSIQETSTTVKSRLSVFDTPKVDTASSLDKIPIPAEDGSSSGSESDLSGYKEQEEIISKKSVSRYFDNEAMEVSGTDSQSTDSNEIIEVGEDIGSEDSDTDGDDSGDDDSFVVDDEEIELLSGSGDDLSDNQASSKKTDTGDSKKKRNRITSITSSGDDLSNTETSNMETDTGDSKKKRNRITSITISSSDEDQIVEIVDTETPQTEGFTETDKSRISQTSKSSLFSSTSTPKVRLGKTLKLDSSTDISLINDSKNISTTKNDNNASLSPKKQLKKNKNISVEETDQNDDKVTDTSKNALNTSTPKINTSKNDSKNQSNSKNESETLESASKKSKKNKNKTLDTEEESPRNKSSSELNSSEKSPKKKKSLENSKSSLNLSNKNASVNEESKQSNNTSKNSSISKVKNTSLNESVASKKNSGKNASLETSTISVQESGKKRKRESAIEKMTNDSKKKMKSDFEDPSSDEDDQNDASSLEDNAEVSALINNYNNFLQELNVTHQDSKSKKTDKAPTPKSKYLPELSRSVTLTKFDFDNIPIRDIMQEGDNYSESSYLEDSDNDNTGGSEDESDSSEEESPQKVPAKKVKKASPNKAQIQVENYENSDELDDSWEDLSEEIEEDNKNKGKNVKELAKISVEDSETDEKTSDDSDSSEEETVLVQNVKKLTESKKSPKLELKEKKSKFLLKEKVTNKEINTKQTSKKSNEDTKNGGKNIKSLPKISVEDSVTEEETSDDSDSSEEEAIQVKNAKKNHASKKSPKAELKKEKTKSLMKEIVKNKEVDIKQTSKKPIKDTKNKGKDVKSLAKINVEDSETDEETSDDLDSSEEEIIQVKNAMKVHENKKSPKFESKKEKTKSSKKAKNKEIDTKQAKKKTKTPEISTKKLKVKSNVEKNVELNETPQNKKKAKKQIEKTITSSEKPAKKKKNKDKIIATAENTNKKKNKQKLVEEKSSIKKDKKSKLIPEEPKSKTKTITKLQPAFIEKLEKSKQLKTLDKPNKKNKKKDDEIVENVVNSSKKRKMTDSAESQKQVMKKQRMESGFTVIPLTEMMKPSLRGAISASKFDLVSNKTKRVDSSKLLGKKLKAYFGR